MKTCYQFNRFFHDGKCHLSHSCRDACCFFTGRDFATLLSLSRLNFYVRSDGFSRQKTAIRTLRAPLGEAVTTSQSLDLPSLLSRLEAKLRRIGARLHGMDQA